MNHLVPRPVLIRIAGRMPLIPKNPILLALAAVALPCLAGAQTTALVELDDFGPRQVKSQSFALASPQDLQIDAAGAELTGKSGWSASMGEKNGKAVPPWSGNAWILDLQSRKVVWELSQAPTTSGSRGLRQFKGTVHLAAGSYTAYYASFPDGEYWSDDNAKHKTDRKWHWFGDDPVENFKFVVHGKGQVLSAADTDRLRASDSALTVVSLRGRFHEQFEEAGFVL